MSTKATKVELTRAELDAISRALLLETNEMEARRAIPRQNKFVLGNALRKIKTARDEV